MSPEPNVRGQALVLGILLALGAAIGSPTAVLIVSVVVALAALGLRRRYRGDLTAAAGRDDTPLYRERLDLIVAGDARAALGVGIATSAALVASGAGPVDVGAAPATPVLLAGAVAVVWLSSLVDWYVILPRVSGQLGLRPCRHPTKRHPRFPNTWRQITMWWYIHRIVAALVLRFGLSLAVALTAARHVDVPHGSAVVAAAAVGFLAAYVAAIPRAVWQAGHPTFVVGATVRRRAAERPVLFRVPLAFGKALAVPSPSRRPLGSPGPRVYVYDVAVEGVDFVEAAPRERRIPRDDADAVVYEAGPEKVPLARLEVAISGDPPFRGCRETCSGISWYCVENPGCYRPK